MKILPALFAAALLHAQETPPVLPDQDEPVPEKDALPELPVKPELSPAADPEKLFQKSYSCLLYTSPSPRDRG